MLVMKGGATRSVIAVVAVAVCLCAAAAAATAAEGHGFTAADVKKAYNDGYADGMQAVLRNYGASLDIDKPSANSFEAAGLDEEKIDAKKKEAGHTKHAFEASCGKLLAALAPYGVSADNDIAVSSSATKLNHFTLLWPTTVYNAAMDKGDDTLLQSTHRIVQKHVANERNDAGAGVFRGWTSGEMLDWQDSGIRKIEKALLSHFKTVLEADSPGSTTSNRINVLLQMWATTLEKGGFELPQQSASAHGAHWTGKLLVAATDSAPTTLVLLSKDTSPAQTWKDEQHQLELRPGDVALFPADIVHYTLPAATDATLVSFNIKVLSEAPDKDATGIFCANCMYDVLV